MEAIQHSLTGGSSIHASLGLEAVDKGELIDILGSLDDADIIEILETLPERGL